MKIPIPEQWKMGIADDLIEWVIYGNNEADNQPLKQTKTSEDIIKML